MLVVAGDVGLRRLIATMLQVHAGVSDVASVSSAKHATRKLDRGNIQVVVLDGDLPEPEVAGVFAAVANRNPYPRVLVLESAEMRNTPRGRDGFAGASAFVRRPDAIVARTELRDAGADIAKRVLALATAKSNGAPTPRRAPEPGDEEAAVAAPVARSASRRRALPRPAASPAPLVRVADSAQNPARPLDLPRPTARAGRVDLVLIGSSTGGPTALAAVLGALPANLPVPVLIVQHLPEAFSDMLAARMHAQSALTVGVAREDVVPQPGEVWLAPGGRHLVCATGPAGYRLALTDSPKVQSCRPAVDVLFQSAAAILGANVLGVVLTGMGYDGLDGSRALIARGSRVIVQDEESSVVWGMPGAVARVGLADAVLPLDRVADEIVRRVSVARSGQPR